jgi:hypothetical protein
MKKYYYFDTPVNVYGDNGTCYEDVVEVHVGDSDEESYVADVNDGILFFSEMDYAMVQDVLKLVEGENIK